MAADFWNNVFDIVQPYPDKKPVNIMDMLLKKVFQEVRDIIGEK